MQLIDADALVDELVRIEKMRNQSGEPMLMADVLWCIAMAEANAPETDTKKTKKKNVNSSDNT